MPLGSDRPAGVGGQREPIVEEAAPPSVVGATETSGAGGKRGQSVLVVVCTRGGEFLLMRRVRPPLFWQSVTGSLVPGESPRLAALREVQEETGLLAGSRLLDLRRSVLFPIIPAWQGRYAPNVRFNREYWFALILESRRTVCLNPAEHLESCWLPAARALALAGSWTNRDAILALAAVTG